MTDEIQDGTKEHPILVWQTGYRCRHATRSPVVQAFQHYKIVGFLDVGGLCPACQAQQPPKKTRKTKVPDAPRG